MSEKGWRAPGLAARNQILMSAHAWLRSALDCKDFVWDVEQWNAADEIANAMAALLRLPPAGEPSSRLVVSKGS